MPDGPVKPASIPGAGPNGGTGYPDLTAKSPTGALQIWEMKSDSAKSRAKGALQIDRYISKARTQLSPGTLTPLYSAVSAGDPFLETHTETLTLCDEIPISVAPFDVQIYSSWDSSSTTSGYPGLEYYKVSFSDIWAIAEALAVAAGVIVDSLPAASLNDIKLGGIVSVRLGTAAPFASFPPLPSYDLGLLSATNPDYVPTA